MIEKQDWGFVRQDWSGGFSVFDGAVDVSESGGVRTRIMHMETRNSLVSIIPVFDLGQPQYFERIKTEAEKAQAVLYDGCPSGKSFELSRKAMKEINEAIRVRLFAPYQRLMDATAIIRGCLLTLEQSLNLVDKNTAIRSLVLSNDTWHDADVAYWEKIYRDRNLFDQYVASALIDIRNVPAREWTEIISHAARVLAHSSAGHWQDVYLYEFLQAFFAPHFIAARATWRECIWEQAKVFGEHTKNKRVAIVCSVYLAARWKKYLRYAGYSNAAQEFISAIDWK